MIRFIQASGNAKLSKNKRVATTYAPVRQSCPSSCRLRGNGCYYECGRTYGLNNRLEQEAGHATPLEIAQAEADAIDRAGIADGLRLHTGGDCQDAAGATAIGEAVGRWRRRGGGPAWTYTHAWPQVPRAAWTPAVSIFASIESSEQIGLARHNGYAIARVIPKFPFGSRSWQSHGILWIPCRFQTDARTCLECRACFQADRMRDRGMGIAFQPDGIQKAKVRRQLAVLG